MSISKTLFGTTRKIPQLKETNWGNEVTNMLSDIVTCLDAAFMLINEVAIERGTVASVSVNAGATLTPVFQHYRISSSTGLGAVTLSATTPIAASADTRQALILEGSSNTDTVKIPNSGTVALNGPIVLRQGTVIILYWNDIRSLWIEASRSE